MQKAFTSSLSKSRKNFRELPSFLHLALFLFAVLIAVMSFNFEVFRVIRLGDLLLVFFAFLIGVNWYGQRMLETGYKDGMRKAAEASKQKRK
jgi:hypothetical protein